MIITFCGHADFVSTQEYRQRVLDLLEREVGDASVDFYLGGYGAFDQFAYSCCKAYQKEHPKALLVFVTPYRVVKKMMGRDPGELYDAILYPPIEDKPLKFAILYRNQYMVEQADLVIAYVAHSTGGAYQSYQYARRKGKTLFNLAQG